MIVRLAGWQRSPKLTPFLRNEVLNLWATKTLSQASIAKELNITPSDVFKAIKEARLKGDIRTNRKRLNRYPAR